jgi:hypothetical protein
MASSTFPPALSALQSSADVFDTAPPHSANYTLPQIRQIHKSIHEAVDDKRNRLRIQVGGSYRDLLGTADKIVSMKGDMDEVLGLLGGMGTRCSRQVVGAKVGGLSRFVGEEEEGHKGVVARGRMMEGCRITAEGLLRGKGVGSRGDKLVMAAKALVLARLLAQSLAGEESVGKGLVRAAKKSLEGLKRRLLRMINKVLGTVGERTDREDVLKALTAYSLATSSGARDVLWQFLKVRGEAMKLTFELDEEERVRGTDDVLDGLRLYSKTLLDVQALVPSRLTEALAALKRQPLIKDAALRKIEGLRLDMYEQWSGDEIEYFTPFIRHDDLDGKHAREMLGKWATDGSDALLKGLERTLADMTELKAIVDMRTSVLRLWIADGGKAKGFDPSELLDQMRETINRHMLNVVEAKVSRLRLVGSEVTATLESWQQGVTDKHQNLWEHDSFDMDLTNGAASFAQDVVSRMYGRNDAVSRAVSSYRSWYHVIDDVGQVVGQLRRQRWDNDEDEIEDEDTLEQRQQLLSEDDPQSLRDSLNSSLVTAFKALDGQLQSSWKTQSDAGGKGRVAMYMLRVLRDTRAQLPDLDPVKGFGLEILPQLHEVVASTVVEAPLRDLTGRVLSQKLVVGKSLWEGEPELPTSPSPGVFKFLRDLSLSMSDAGMDLWYPALLTALKQLLGRQLREGWLEAADKLEPMVKPEEEKEGLENTKSEGEAETKDEQVNSTEEATIAIGSEATDEQRKELLVQWLFDVMYLRCCLKSSSSSANDLKDLEDAIHGQTGLDKAALERVSKASQDHWKRTSLLFGLFK